MLMLFVLTLVAAATLIVAGSPVEKYVMDSTAYTSELNWDKEALGEPGDLAGWKEQSFTQKNGDLWRVNFVCDIASNAPNNWLRLPFVNREEANRLIIKLEYTIRECKRYPGEIRTCKETFQLLYVESDAAEPAPAFSEHNYKYLKTIAPNNVVAGAGENGRNVSVSTSSSAPQPQQQSSQQSIFRTEVDLPLRSQKQGVYVAFRDQGACVSLLSIKIYYTLCSTQIHNLVIYPKTPTGSNLTDLVPRMGHCIQNAESRIASTPYAYCQTNGNWFITSETNEKNVCMCKPGHFYDPNSVQCIACPQGKFKAALSNQAECSDCPENSWTNNYGSKSCACSEGYHRLSAENYSSPCLPMPTEPKNLTVYYLDQTSIKLRWDPIENYGIGAVNYKLECYKCIERATETAAAAGNKARRNALCNERARCERHVQISPSRNEITTNKATLSALDSNTQYLVEIYAEHVKGLFKTKTVDIMIRTFQDIKDLAVANLTAYYLNDANELLVAWSDTPPATRPLRPSSGNASFLAYEVRYWPKNEYDKAGVLSVKAPAQNCSVSLLGHVYEPRGLVYQVQVRAQGSQGWGPFSRPVDSLRVNSLAMLASLANASLGGGVGGFLSQFQPQSVEQLRESNGGYTTSAFYNPMLFLNNKPQEFVPTYIAIAVAGSVFFVVGSLAIIILLTRSGKIKLLNKLTKPSGAGVMGGGLGGHSSDSDSIDFAKRTAQMAYNQLGACSAGTGSSTGSGGSSPMWPPLNNNASFKTYIDPHTYEDPTKAVNIFAKELAASSIIIESVIGGGEFGDVCKGRLKLTPWSEATVAIKTLKGAATEQSRCNFLTEASIMAQFTDPNVIRLEGVVTQGHPLMIVTEYMENGSLDTFLRLNENKLKITQLVRMLRDVASGMRYLSEMNYIHRDLAARNILVSQDLVCKVADFGLSREIADESNDGVYQTQGGKIPVRWTAPEAIFHRKFTCASDVWSFGVLVWEVLSFGERPYWSWSNSDVIKAVSSFYRLPPPNNCADCLYKLMQKCWHAPKDHRAEQKVLDRPKFNEIVLLLDELLAYPDELRKPTKVRELLPINPQYPTQIQLTSTKQFLTKLDLPQYDENFDRVGLQNLANLFQLEAKDLAYTLHVHSTYDQKKIVQELKYIRDGYNASLATMTEYKLNIGYSTNQYQQAPQQPPPPSSAAAAAAGSSTIFNILRPVSGVQTPVASCNNSGFLV